MRMPEIVTTAGSMDELQRVILAGADAVTIGEQRWGTRLPGDFDIGQIGEAVRWAHGKRAKIYVAVTNIMSNEDIQALPDYLHALSQSGADAVVFGDPSVMMVLRQITAGPALHWNAEMTATNYATANFWAGKGARRAVLARELNMSQIIEFKQNSQLELQVQVHGITNIYHSRRNLIGSYLDHKSIMKEGEMSSMNRGLYLVEAERQELRHPIFEDYSGTHIMSADDICMLENLPELIEAGIDSFKIEGLLKSVEYNETVVRTYRSVIEDYAADPSAYTFDDERLLAIQQLQDPNRELTFGFFYKEQVY